MRDRGWRGDTLRMVIRADHPGTQGYDLLVASFTRLHFVRQAGN
jgi:hypothetical protein